MSSEANKIETTSDEPSSDLTAVIDDLITQLTTKFSKVSLEILAKMDDMSRRLDNLETLIQQNTASNITNTTNTKVDT